MERREFKRLEIHLPASYKLLDIYEANETTTVVNISHGGICFSTEDKSIAANTRIELKIRLDAKETVALRAIVIWSSEESKKNKFKNGVKITDDSSTKDRAIFERFCHLKLVNPPQAF